MILKGDSFKKKLIELFDFFCILFSFFDLEFCFREFELSSQKRLI